MTIQEIQTRNEDQTFDCKSIQIEPKALAIPIVAFANADGGVIAIGVSDKTRKIEGIDQHIDKLNELLRVPFDFCNPSIPITCTYVPCKDKDGNDNRILLMHIPASSRTEKLTENPNRLTENKEKLIEKLIEKASINGDKLTENKIAILTFMIEDPYISKSDLSKFVGISTAAISNNIEAMRGKYLRRVGPDKGGFWEIIE